MVHGGRYDWNIDNILRLVSVILTQTTGNKALSKLRRTTQHYEQKLICDIATAVRATDAWCLSLLGGVENRWAATWRYIQCLPWYWNDAKKEHIDLTLWVLSLIHI